jgi:hypothetical protein
MQPEARTLSNIASLALPFRIVTVIGGFLLAMGAIVSPARIWPSLLWSGISILGVGVAALYFLAIHSVTGAAWATSLKRIPEAMTGLVPAGGLLVLIAIAFGAPTLYPALAEGGAKELPAFKQLWYLPGFYFFRSVAYALLLSAFAWGFRRISRRQDEDRDLVHTLHARRLSAVFLVVGSFLVVLLSIDWLMALEPWWYSTIFGVYHFAGLFQSGLAVLLLFLVWIKRQGIMGAEINRDHVQDVAKFMFGMSTFWMYIWYSQYVLIWYTNIPEETTYFTLRMTGSWLPLFFVNPVLNWVIPFHVLMARAPKRSLTIASRVAVVILVGRALDLYLMIYPPLLESGPRFGLVELGVLLATVGLVGIVVIRTLGGASLVPIGDPYLEESLHHHQ